MDYTLVIDDNDLILRSLARALRTQAQHAITTTRVAEAKRLVEQEAPAAVVTDLRLPGHCGPDFIEWMRGRAPITPLYVYTGIDCSRLAALCGRLGANDYFVKGRDTRRLLSALRGMHEPLSARLEPEILKCIVTSEDQRRSHVLGVLELCNGNVSETARLLAVPRPTLQRWLRAYAVTSTTA